MDQNAYDQNAHDQNAHDNFILARSRLWTPDLDKLLRKWKKQVGKKEMGHRELSRKYARRHYTFGLPAVILSTLITAGAFATFQECGDCDDRQSTQCKAEVWIRLTVGILGIISIGLTSAVTFLNYQVIAEDHKGAADQFGERFRQIEGLLLIPGPFRGDPITVLQNIRSQYDNDVRCAPVLPKKYDLELTYDVIHHKPPSPGQIVINLERKRRDTDVLKKVLTDEEGSSDDSVAIPIDEELDERNQCDTDGEENICIGFDIDGYPNYTNDGTILAVAALAAKTREKEQQSLIKALEFEMQRMDMDMATQMQYDKKGSGRKKVKERRKGKFKAKDPEEEENVEDIDSSDISSQKKEKKENINNRQLESKDDSEEIVQRDDLSG